MMLYTRGKPGKVSLVMSNVTDEDLSLLSEVIPTLKSTKFFVYERNAQ